MTGRIHDEDIAQVRERIRIDDVVREYVAIKPAGGGSFKGLCPFHDERSPSFHVTPSKGMFYCFGCQEGGDAITFLQKMDHLSFTEAIEKLAAKFGVTLRYVEGNAGIARQQGQRARLIAAHRAAADFFTAQLKTPEASIARTFLDERGFAPESWSQFSLGYAPKSWDGLTKHLRSQGFSDEEMLVGGLVSQGNRGVYDRFRGRLVWPIRELGGEVVGFGARRLHDDDEGPKYLNTPETPLYKKSQVLYGIDLARREISKAQSVVVVEGYTDVMACHLAGVPTAVATCGTAFGADHIRVLRRLLMDDDRMRGEVIFTFDGDEAGRRAALKAFGDDQKFVSQTFVAVEPNGLDPCDLRLQHGDSAVVGLVEAKVPLFEFAIKSTLTHYDIESAEGRINALREAAPIVANIKDPALRPEYVRRLAGWLGLEETAVKTAMGQVRSAPSTPSAQVTRAQAPAASGHAAPSTDPMMVLQREALKCALQEPELVATWYASVESGAYPHPAYAQLHEAIMAAGGPGAGLGGAEWIEAVLAACPDDDVRRGVRALAVEPLPVRGQVDSRYTTSVIASLLVKDASRRIEALRGRVQRADEGGADRDVLFGELMALEAYRRELRQQADT
ncbi:MAG: DNA primase [Candidatus Nanopelagicales bacterium]